MTFGSFSARSWSENFVLLGTKCAGSLALNAGNNFTQNAALFGALGVTAHLAGAYTAGPTATTGSQPVTYLEGTTPVRPPPDPAVVPETAPSLVTAFLTQFEQTMDPSAGVTTSTVLAKNKNRLLGDVVLEDEICRP